MQASKRVSKKSWGKQNKLDCCPSLKKYSYIIKLLCSEYKCGLKTNNENVYFFSIVNFGQTVSTL